mgnify:CR=1 FL=1
MICILKKLMIVISLKRSTIVPILMLIDISQYLKYQTIRIFCVESRFRIEFQGFSNYIYLSNRIDPKRVIKSKFID